MRLIHASGFKSSEREGFRVVVFFNVFTTMQTLLEALELMNLQITDPTALVCSISFIFYSILLTRFKYVRFRVTPVYLLIHHRWKKMNPSQKFISNLSNACGKMIQFKKLVEEATPSHFTTIYPSKL